MPKLSILCNSYTMATSTTPDTQMLMHIHLRPKDHSYINGHRLT